MVKIWKIERIMWLFVPTLNALGKPATVQNIAMYLLPIFKLTISSEKSGWTFTVVPHWPAGAFPVVQAWLRSALIHQLQNTPKVHFCVFNCKTHATHILAIFADKAKRTLAQITSIVIKANASVQTRAVVAFVDIQLA